MSGGGACWESVHAERNHDLQVLGKASQSIEYQFGLKSKAVRAIAMLAFIVWKNEGWPLWDLVWPRRPVIRLERHYPDPRPWVNNVCPRCLVRCASRSR